MQYDISIVSGRAGHASIFSKHLIRLLGCSSLVDHMPSLVTCSMDRVAGKSLEPNVINLSPVGPPRTLVNSFKGRGKCRKAWKLLPSKRLNGVKAELACAKAKCLLDERKSVLAQQVLNAALADVGSECRDYGFSLVRAWLHYYMGVAIAQQLEERVKLEVWFKNTSNSQLHRRCVEEFMQCYQLCFPVMPTILLRETCLWLALLLVKPDHAHHFLSISMQTSLVHEMMLSLGKKLR